MSDLRKQFTESETRAVTAEEAKHYLDSTPFERQRRLAEWHVEILSEEVRQGSFVPGSQVYFGVLPDGTMMCLNGRHTLAAVAASGTEQVLTLTFQSVKNLDEAGLIYAVFDTHRARSWSDSIKGSGKSESLPWANKMVPAIGLLMQDFVPKNKVSTYRSRAKRIKAIPQYEKAAQMLVSSVEGGPMAAYIRKRAPVLAVALATFLEQPSGANEFWAKVAYDDGLTEGEPAKTLLRYLIGHPVGGKTGWPLQMVACATGWNAFFDDRPLHVIHPYKTTKISIRGTRWDAANAAPRKRGRPRLDGKNPNESPLKTGVAVTPDGLVPATSYGTAG